MYIFNLIVYDDSPDCSPSYDRATVVTFQSEVRSAEENLERARKAVANYLSTEEGKQQRAYNNGQWNWGDSVACIPNAYWAAYGLVPVYNDCTNVSVIHDEEFEEE